nr:mechanosensitive ion channel [Desulfobulbaceae bacterium]
MSTIANILNKQGWPESIVNLTLTCLSIVIIIIAAFLLLWFSRRLFVPVLERAIIRSSFKWDDFFVERKFFVHLSRLVPIIIIYAASDVFFVDQPVLNKIVKRLAMTLLVLGGAKCLDTLLLVVRDIYQTKPISRDKPIAGYLSVIKIIVYIFAAIFVVAVLTDKSPWGIFSVLGGLTAVLLLIFKDTILGFVASLQLSGNNMVRVGDWIEMPEYKADGDVIDVSIHTVKVKNWDKTITTIPTYALVANSFKNWRGMSESGGRRIKRSIHIDMNSVCFCTEAMLEKFSKFSLITAYIEAKNKEIAEHNQKLGLTANSEVLNGRSQTNIGVFRAYVKAYLQNHPKIHDNMTFLVRHLAPTSKGLPIEIYVFSNDQVWANYESIQADIFDHILAVVPEFGLRVFQEPSGADIQALGRGH